MEIKMLVAVGKGIELDVDVSRLNDEVRDHVMRTGLRNLLMDAHASATGKAYPDNYVAKCKGNLVRYLIVVIEVSSAEKPGL
jgi:hypothetical protein